MDEFVRRLGVAVAYHADEPLLGLVGDDVAVLVVIFFLVRPGIGVGRAVCFDRVEKGVEFVDVLVVGAARKGNSPSRGSE